MTAFRASMDILLVMVLMWSCQPSLQVGSPAKPVLQAGSETQPAVVINAQVGPTTRPLVSVAVPVAIPSIAPAAWGSCLLVALALLGHVFLQHWFFKRRSRSG